MPPTPEHIWEILHQHRFRFTSERDLQDAIAEALTNADIPHEREYPLSRQDRPDFIVGENLALEVKIKGGLTAVTRQLHRYAQHERVHAILLVTTRANHRRLPATMNGRRVYVLHLNPLA